MTRKILLDTDIGSDIDDAVCLAYLLAHPDCELLGITTVTGEPVKRAMLASALCRAAGREVPIYPGAESPLLTLQRQPRAPQAEALDRWDHAREFPPAEAVEFLRRTVRAHPGEVTLLAIGPLTNVGLLFAVDPEIPLLLRELVLMCGVFTNRLANVGPREWNAIGDPHATAIVYRAPVKVHRSIGLDVTCRVQMDAAEVRQRFRGRYLRPVLDFAEVWFRHTGTLTFHDPLAATTLFDSQICRFTPGQVEVELASDRGAGMTWWREEAQGPHQVALEVDAGRFFDHYLATTARED
jgi:inosine-uridine nucleoside N-ribohydrolase